MSRNVGAIDVDWKSCREQGNSLCHHYDKLKNAISSSARSRCHCSFHSYSIFPSRTPNQMALWEVHFSSRIQCDLPRFQSFGSANKVASGCPPRQRLTAVTRNPRACPCVCVKIQEWNDQSPRAERGRGDAVTTRSSRSCSLPISLRLCWQSSCRPEATHHDWNVAWRFTCEGERGLPYRYLTV